jgi:hypothetical protein
MIRSRTELLLLAALIVCTAVKIGLTVLVIATRGVPLVTQ